MALKLTDEQLSWLVERIPDPPKSPLGGRPCVDKRKVIRGIFWILDHGAKWKDLPRRFGTKSTVHRWFQIWVCNGVFENFLRQAGRCVEQRGEYRLYECFIDGTFVKARGGGDGIGCTKAGKGVKIMILVDARSLPVAVHTGSASPHESKLVQHLFDFMLTQETPPRVIGDKASARFLPFFPGLGRGGEGVQPHGPGRAGSFCKGVVMSGCCKNPVHPEPPPHGRHGVGERPIDFSGPGEEVGPRLFRGKPGVPQRDHGKQSEQTWRGAQHRLLAPAARHFQAQIGAHLLERGLDGPTAGERLDDRLRCQGHVSGEEVVVPVGSRKVVNEDPTDENQPFPILEPMPHPRNDFDAPRSAAVPRGGEFSDERLRRLGYPVHQGLLAQVPRVVFQLLLIPTRRLRFV